MLRHVFFGFAAGLLLVGIPADAQIRPDSRGTKGFNWKTRNVTITVDPSDYIGGNGTATVTVNGVITGYVRPRAPWYVTVRSDPYFELKRDRDEVHQKPCNEMAIRWAQGPAGAWRILSPNNQVVAAGVNTTEGRVDVEFDLRFAAHPDDVSGEYTIELYFEYSN